MGNKPAKHLQPLQLLELLHVPEQQVPLLLLLQLPQRSKQILQTGGGEGGDILLALLHYLPLLLLPDALLFIMVDTVVGTAHHLNCSFYEK